VLHIGLSAEFDCASGHVNRSLDLMKERVELIEGQLTEKDREYSGIGPWRHGKGGEICFYLQSRSDLDSRSVLIPCHKVSPTPSKGY